MSVSVLFPDSADHSKVHFQSPRRLNNGALRVDMRYKSETFDQELVYQTCNFRKGYVKEYKDEKSGKKSLKLECLLLGHENPYSDCHGFVDAWKKIESRVTDTAKSKSREWFKVCLFSYRWSHLRVSHSCSFRITWGGTLSRVGHEIVLMRTWGLVVPRFVPSFVLLAVVVATVVALGLAARDSARECSREAPSQPGR